jgi:hypothetical protein
MKLLESILLASTVLVLPVTAGALDLKVVDTGPAVVDGRQVTVTKIAMNGDIEENDYFKYAEFMEKLHTEYVVATIASSGGDVIQALLIAQSLQNRPKVVKIIVNEFCFSACFYIFASAPQKEVAALAPIGGHRVKEKASNLENMNAWKESEAISRYLRSKGVPASIVNNIYAASPSEMYELTWDDEKAMHAKINWPTINDLREILSNMPGRYIFWLVLFALFIAVCRYRQSLRICTSRLEH